MNRLVLFLLLAIVAAAAAILSFASLDALARAVGFPPQLSWLFPLVLDCGCAAGTTAWLSRPPGLAQVFGRRLAIVLIASSVAGNGAGHVITAYQMAVPWWLITLVAAYCPAVLGMVVHLTVLVLAENAAAQASSERPELAVEPTAEPSRTEETPDPVDNLIAEGVGRRRLAKELGVSEHQARQLLAARTNGHRAEVGDDD